MLPLKGVELTAGKTSVSVTEGQRHRRKQGTFVAHAGALAVSRACCQNKTKASAQNPDPCTPRSRCHRVSVCLAVWLSACLAVWLSAWPLSPQST